MDISSNSAVSVKLFKPVKACAIPAQRSLGILMAMRPDHVFVDVCVCLILCGQVFCILSYFVLSSF